MINTLPAKVIGVILLLIAVFCSVKCAILTGLGVWSLYTAFRYYGLLHKKYLKGNHILVTVINKYFLKF